MSRKDAELNREVAGYNVDSATENTEFLASRKATEGIAILLGDLKKAVVKLSIPIIVAMSVQTIYNLTDAFWISGLGADAWLLWDLLFPFCDPDGAYWRARSWRGAAISRRIGARDKTGADNVAVNTFVIMLVLTVALTVLGLALIMGLFMYSGEGKITGIGVEYARVIFAGSFIFFFTNVANSILRSEGDSKRDMKAMIVGSVFNIVLDPFLYTPWGLGLQGRPWLQLSLLPVRDC